MAFREPQCDCPGSASAVVGFRRTRRVPAGAHGLLIEVHPNPDVAKCDGAQSLTLENFSLLLDQVYAINSVRQAPASA